ncbi:MAG: hypothetical protein ACK6CT_10210 [Planctomycetia bacterium]|jgi:hypothetical protein
MNAPAGPGETWLRGNLRPAAVLAALSAALTLIAVAVALVCGAPLILIGALGGAGGLAVVGAGLLAAAAGRPRLQLQGSALRVRLAPFAVHDVPLEVVECVFLGSRSLYGMDDTETNDGRRRVATLVLRIAERATGWRSRPTTRAWGTWEDGNVVCDGRWCEPLTAGVVREVAQRLLDAKRAAAAAAGTSAGAEP